MAAANAALSEDRHIVLRVGINLGDMMVENSSLNGDGVNDRHAARGKRRVLPSDLERKAPFFAYLICQQAR